MEFLKIAFSLAFTVFIVAALLYHYRDSERAAEDMYRSARQAEDAGDHALAERRYRAANNMDN